MISIANQQQMPSTTITAVGSIVFDLRGFASGRKYWQLTIWQAWTILRSTAPLALWLCFLVGLGLVIQITDVMGLIGADRGLAGIAVGAAGLRELGVTVAAVGLGASAGAGFVTELGAMRVAEEIDALEVMGVDSHTYLISTRLWGALLAAFPLIVFCVAATFLGGWLAAIAFSDVVSLGSFSQYFWRSLIAIDFVYALIKGTVLVMLTTLICTSLGYRASGGPVGVGLAVGKALDLSIVSGALINLALSYLFWGLTDTLKV